MLHRFQRSVIHCLLS